MKTPTLKQFQGTLIAQCLGDALGAPVEARSRAYCQAYVETLLNEPNFPFSLRANYPSGQYTDDSQLARELLQSYVACESFDPSDYAERIRAIFEEHRIVGRGRATTQAVGNLRRGIHWTVAGMPAPIAGNGSAMRAAPIGLIYWNNPPEMILASHDQSRITHRDPRAIAGATAISGAVALALQSSLSMDLWIDRLSRWIFALDERLAEGIKLIPEWLTLSHHDAVTTIAQFGLTPDHPDYGREFKEWRITPFVTGSVLWSLYAFLKSPDDPMQTILTAIAGGGDTDTTASMAAAISGAYLGLDALPERLTAQLTDQGTWGYDELCDLAQSAYELVTRT